MRDSHVGLRGPNQPTQVVEVLGHGFGIPPREVAVGLGVDGDDATAQLAEKAGAGQRPGAVAGVECHRQVRVRDAIAVHGVEEGVDVLRASVFDPPAASGVVPRDERELLVEQPFLDPFEGVPGEFHAVGADELHPVVLRGVVAGSHHQAGDALALRVGLERRRREDAHAVDVTADRREAAGGAVGEHLAGRPRVPPQRDAL